MVNINVKNIDVRAVVNTLVSLTPLLFLIIGVCSFTLFGLFECQYYYAISHAVIKQIWLSSIFCVAFPIILETAQFGFMLATISNFSNRKQEAGDGWFNFDLNLLFAFLGLLATCVIIYYKLGELDNMVGFWEAGNPKHSEYIKSGLKVLILLGIMLEIRIIMILKK